MGNQLTAPSRLTAAEAVSDLQSVTYKDSLGEGEVAVSAAAPPTLAAGSFVRACCLLPACQCASPYLEICRAGGGRFFKSALCVHDDGGLVVVKVRSAG